ELHVAERAMAVDGHLLPVVVGPGVIGIVVADDVPPSAHVHQDRLVHVPGDVVLHQVVRGEAAQDDAVAVGAEAVVRRMVDVLAPDHGGVPGPERDVPPADGPVGLHVLHPAEGGVGDVDTAGGLAVVATHRPALHPQALDARPAHGGATGDAVRLGE